MPGHSFAFQNKTIADISEVLILKNSSSEGFSNSRSWQNTVPLHLELNSGSFLFADHELEVSQNGSDLVISCSCDDNPGNLCEWQSQVLIALIRRDYFRAFFDADLRRQKIVPIAQQYGFDHEAPLDEYFRLELSNGRLEVKPLDPGLLPVAGNSLEVLSESLFQTNTQNPANENAAAMTSFLVLRQHKYYRYLNIELYEGALTRDGNLKNPFKLISPLDHIWKADDQRDLRFYAALNKFQGHRDSQRTEADLAALKAIVSNPIKLPVFVYDDTKSEKVTSSALVPVDLRVLSSALSVKVREKPIFYELMARASIDGTACDLRELPLKLGYFLERNGVLYLLNSLEEINLVHLLKKRSDRLLIHGSKYKEFREALLNRLEDRLEVHYDFIKPASVSQLKNSSVSRDFEKLIYLSDFGQDVNLLPVVRYGDVEVPLRSKRNIYGIDAFGKEFFVQRQEDEELKFTALLVKQHPWFEEQLENDLHYFYLNKHRFLDDDWFLNTFEDWKNHGITVLGFNELEGNKLNPHKVKITIRVLSGVNWFNALINARYGKKQASLKQIQKAIKNKNKYVQLHDGSLGILPAEWIEKFSQFFNAGEITDEETLRIPKINFTEVERMYEEEMLDSEVKREISEFKENVYHFKGIEDLGTPNELRGILRPYQQQGLNWLGFLDRFNFGGCLADDMGLGKSVQIIAFILHLRETKDKETHLIVVPASLIFNWQDEFKKFCPNLKILTIYGNNRAKSTANFDLYDVVLTSYGTLLSDISFLKAFPFGYVFLDESQNIKNPDSQRYKAVRLLKSRNRIVITGTPIENNTFDLYGQFSFACPGLLGNKRHFRDIYSTPIDKFGNTRRARELHDKISPFILRRTKQQVARELPEKTEMIIYCELGVQQRKIYDAYEKEFREYISATTNDEIRKSPMNVLKGLTKLRQICNSPMLLSGDTLKSDESVKIATLLEQIENKAPEHKILVFSQFVAMLDLIQIELKSRKIPYSYLTGSTRNREQVVNEFQNDSAKRVFLISLKAGGTGLNLTEADYVYLVEPWWNPAVEAQAIDRSHRIGQDKKVVALRLICRDTVEEKIMSIQRSKQELVNDLVRANGSAISTLSKETLLELLNSHP